MATKRWRELSKTQQDDVKKRLSSPYQAYDGNPYIYYVENGRVARRHLSQGVESRREMRKFAKNPYRD